MPSRLAAPPLLVAHRGASDRAPENTLAAFEAAAGAGAHFVEFDARLASDGELVVFHDATLERTTDADGPVSARSQADLAALDAGSWFDTSFAREGVPALADVLALLEELDLGANIELKAETPEAAAATARAWVALCERHAAPGADVWPDALLLSSLHPEALEVLAESQPDRPRALVVERPDAGTLALARRLGCGALHVNHRALRPELLREVLASELLLGAYTVNDPERAEQLWEAGVTTIFSDVPDLPAVPSGTGPDRARGPASAP